MSNKVKFILVNGVVTERTLGGTEHKTVWNRANLSQRIYNNTSTEKFRALFWKRPKREKSKKQREVKPERASLSNRTPNQVGYGLGFRV